MLPSGMEGKLQLNTNQSLMVHGDWTNNATFTADTNSTVSLAGTNEVNVSGSSNTFYNLSSTTSGKIIKFEAGKTNTVNGKLTLNGVTLNSTQEGTWWYLNLVNAGETYQDVSGVTVRDSNAGNGQTIIAGPYPFSKDKGHNVNWTFLRPAGTVFSIQ